MKSCLSASPRFHSGSEPSCGEGSQVLVEDASESALEGVVGKEYGEHYLYQTGS
jgi:hypothetical protein